VLNTYILHCESKNATRHSWITLAYDDWLTKFFHDWIQQGICNKTLVTFLTTTYISYYTTLRNLKCHFCHFSTTINIHRNMFLFTRITICLWLNINFLSCARSVVSSLSSSKTIRHLTECAQPPCQCLPLQPSEIGRQTHIHFIRPVAPTATSESSEIQNLCKNAAKGLPEKSSWRAQTDIMACRAWLWATHQQ